MAAHLTSLNEAMIKRLKFNRPGPTGLLWSSLPPARFIAAALLIAIFVFQGCRLDTATKEPSREEREIEYLLLMQQTSAVGACEIAMIAALACADTAGGSLFQAAFTTALESTYSITIADPKAASDICAVLPDAASFPNPLDTSRTYTIGAKICLFECERAFWERQTSGGTCTASGYSSLSTASDSQYRTCTETCLTRGTVFSTPPIDSTTPSPTL